MKGFLIRTGISALGLWIASAVVPSISFTGWPALLMAALLLGVVNAIVRPLMLVLTFPITLVTLGLFLLVVNAAMLGLVAAMLDGFDVGGFWAAVFGAIIVGLTGWMGSWWIGPKGNVEVMVVSETRRVG
jgi:putative membrane protein